MHSPFTHITLKSQGNDISKGNVLARKFSEVPNNEYWKKQCLKPKPSERQTRELNCSPNTIKVYNLPGLGTDRKKKKKGMGECKGQKLQ